MIIFITIYLFFTATSEPPQCQAYQFACANGDCIYAFEECNSVDDCGDASDEHDQCGGKNYS